MAPEKKAILVFIERPGLDEEKHLVITLPREKLAQHSAGFAAFLKTWPVTNESRREITLPEGAPSALHHVLSIIKAHNNRQQLYISLKDLSIEQKLAVWNACHVLEIRPKKALEAVGNNLGWVISHIKMTPEIMRATYDCTRMWQNSDDRQKTKIWRAMIHQYVWDLIHGKFTAEEEEALVDAYSPFPDLATAIDEKFQELKAKNLDWRRNQIENARRRAQRRIHAFIAKREAAMEQPVEEVAAELRPMREDIKDAVLTRQRNSTGDGTGKGKVKVTEQ